MNIVLVDQLSKSFGEKVLFKEITFGIEEGQKVALVARNGAGKSTLLRIMAGGDDADAGKVTYRRDLRVAYLPQNPVFNEDNTVIGELFNAENAIMQAISEYEACLQIMQKDHSTPIQQRMEKAMSRMDALQAWDYEVKVKEILSKFEIGDLEQPVSMLSGGQRKKLALARALIEEADLLLMDEPTNHLDISMIEWMEEYFKRQRMTLLVVTHDRYFLDNVCDEILELDRNQIYKYKGNYSYFLEKKAEREAIEANEIEKARSLYRNELEWMKRMPKARGTKAKARIDSFHEIKDKAFQKTEEKIPQLELRMSRLGGKVLEVHNINKSYGPLKIVSDFTYTFKKGERIGIVGKNGVGKSTLLNLLTGKERPDNGRVIQGQTLVVGYYSQEGFVPQEDRRIIDIVKDIAEEIPLGKGTVSASAFLNYFGFTYPNQYNYFSSLSGGEKRRLFLLMQFLRQPNFLILDEPTNDLDVFTLTLLEDFLLTYPGCLVIVSHDRYFMDKLVDHVFVFEGNGLIKDYYGNYTEYYRDKLAEEQDLKSRQKQEKELKVEPRVKEPSKKPTFKQQREYEALTKEIEELETEKSDVLAKMNSGLSSADELNVLSVRYVELERLLEEKEYRWLELSELF
ncbi:MAG: ABC-F family ATP-binding cassette domain-containing protein [Bacteroidota bacterium]|nr:ABC-F family ATP-binding cassette domain-containing protein [Bacteroidota bacterium]